MSWKCKKCESKEDITVIETVNYHNCKFNKNEEIKDFVGKTMSTYYWCENCGSEDEDFKEIAEWIEEK